MSCRVIFINSLLLSMQPARLHRHRDVCASSRRRRRIHTHFSGSLNPKFVPHTGWTMDGWSVATTMAVHTNMPARCLQIVVVIRGSWAVIKNNERMRLFGDEEDFYRVINARVDGFRKRRRLVYLKKRSKWRRNNRCFSFVGW